MDIITNQTELFKIKCDYLDISIKYKKLGENISLITNEKEHILHQTENIFIPENNYNSFYLTDIMFIKDRKNINLEKKIKIDILLDDKLFSNFNDIQKKIKDYFICTTGKYRIDKIHRNTILIVDLCNLDEKKIEYIYNLFLDIIKPNNGIFKKIFLCIS